jgi:hypothetical protein
MSEQGAYTTPEAVTAIVGHPTAALPRWAGGRPSW